MPEIFRHANGGGKVHGVAGAISSDSRLDRESEMRGKAFVSFMSDIRDNSVITDSSIACSRVSESVVVNSQVTYARVEGSALNGVVIRGADDPVLLRNMILSNGVTVEACKLTDFEFDVPVLLHCDWSRRPRTFDLKEFGIPLHAVECHCKDEPRAVLGCKCRPIREWIEKKELLRQVSMKRNNWPHGVVDVIHEHFKEWLRT